MRVAVLYDIHGNLPALEAVLAEVHDADVDRVIVGGDVVPGPMPRECLEALLGLDLRVQFIQGNGEREVLARLAGEESSAAPERFREVIRWTGERLGPELAHGVAAWPQTLRIETPGLGEVLFCHATPRSDVELFTKRTSDERLLPMVQEAGAPVVVCGHTHMPFDRQVGGVRVINAGSVGMPFGEPGAYWLLLGPGVEPRRTAYDLDAAAARVRRTEYPQADEFAAGSILRPQTEDAALALFSRAEAG